ncbi:zinc-binding metallopeptidase [Sinomicrobium sp. M5D2P9]
MKYTCKYIMLFVLLPLLWACNKEDSLSPESRLDTATPTLSELDVWIRKNFINPYNIDVGYKWDGDEVDQNKFLYPPTEENVKPLLEVVAAVWIDPYNALAGEDFIKRYAPRQLFLVGGYNVNQSGTITLGVAESGMKITLFNVDQLDLSDLSGTRRYFHTIQHEYCHILNQNKPFNPEYGKITPSGYTAQWFNTKIDIAREQGFITSYAKASDFEDFAEMTSTMLSMSKEEFDAIVNGITSETAKTSIRKKEGIVVEYFESAWSIDIYELQKQIDEKMREIINNHNK